MFLRLLLFALLLTMTAFSQIPTIETGVPQTLAKWRAAHYSDVRYKLNLALEKGAPALKGTMEIRVNVRQSDEETKKPDEKSGAFQIFDSPPTIILDWRKIKGKENLSTISNVSVNGRVVNLNPDFSKFNFVVDGQEEQNFFEINEHLVFRDGVKIGENVIKLDFTSPIAPSGAAITRYVDKEDGAEYVYSLFVPSDASTAFPVFDQPDLKARFQLNLAVPQEWRVVSNEISRRKIKRECLQGKFCPTVHIFEETKPISTYVFAFAAGDFDMFVEGFNKPVREIPVNERDAELSDINKYRIYIRKSQAEKFKQHAAETFRLNREAVKYLESYFDFKFPFPKYDLVLIPEFPFNGMEHAGATFLRESSVIFPSEPTKNDLVSRANVIFHEAAHQWFGDTVTMKWFDDLWLKEGFAEFMAYKTLEKTMPEYNAWKAFYERNKPLAYLTDSTKGTTPIYQEIPNLNSAKSAYGNIVYRKAPSFLRQAEFYLGEEKFQRAVRQFLKKYQFKNAEWTDLVNEFEEASGQNLQSWASVWVKKRGMPVFRMKIVKKQDFADSINPTHPETYLIFSQSDILNEQGLWIEKLQLLYVYEDGRRRTEAVTFQKGDRELEEFWGVDFKGKATKSSQKQLQPPQFIFPNYQDYGYGIFLLDERSRDYVLKNIGSEKDDFLRSMMWGALWDSVREAELAPKDYVELAIKNLSVETDELTIQTILSRVSTAMNYYLSDAQRDELTPRVEKILLERMSKAETAGQRITLYRAYLNIASSQRAQQILKQILESGGAKTIEIGFGLLDEFKFKIEIPPLKTKDKFDIIAKLLILENKRIPGNNEAEKLLAQLEKNETSDDAKRYAYAARAGIATAENKAKLYGDFTVNREISESWIEAAFAPFNAVRHSELTLPYLEKALAELPNLKRNRKIFFVNGWLGAFIGGQKNEKALAIVNKFLAANPNLDKDLRLKILENMDALERAVKIRAKYRK